LIEDKYFKDSVAPDLKKISAHSKLHDEMISTAETLVEQITYLHDLKGTLMENGEGDLNQIAGQLEELEREMDPIMDLLEFA
jgi:uncharacterized protein Yka (UPF0111/DUF47 family)